MSNTAELEELRRKKLAYLEKAHTLETRSDEKFRLGYVINEIKEELTESKRDNAPRFLTRYAPSYNPEQMIGRRDLLRTIHAQLTNGNQVVLVNGIGGIGKTTVAQAYINLPEYAACYHHIAWVSVFGSIRDDMLRELATDATGFEYQPNEDPAANFQRLIDCLQRISGVNLLILDNANQADDLIAVKKQIHALRWKTLFTSRAALFRRFYRKPIDENLLAHLLTTIEYHTLLTDLLAKAGNENPALNLQQLCDLLDAQGIAAEPLQAEIFTEHQLSRQDELMRVTLRGYLLKIFDDANLSDAEQQYLRYFSILPSQAEPYDVLVDFFQIKDEQHTAFGKTLKALVRKGWLTEDEQGRFKAHPVIQVVMRDKLSPNAQNCNVLIYVFAQKMYCEGGDNPLERVKYIPYAERIVQCITENDEEVAILINNLGLIVKATGNYQKALEHQLKVCVIREQVLPVNHPNLVTSYDHLAVTYRQLGELEHALTYHQKAIAICEQVLPANHPDLAQSYNNFAATYYTLKEYDMAKAYIDKAVAIYQRALPLEHPHLKEALRWQQLITNALTASRVG